MTSFLPRIPTPPARLALLAMTAFVVLTLSTSLAAEHQPPVSDTPRLCGKTPVEIYREAAPSVVQIFAFGINHNTASVDVREKVAANAD